MRVVRDTRVETGVWSHVELSSAGIVSLKISRTKKLLLLFDGAVA